MKMESVKEFNGQALDPTGMHLPVPDWVKPLQQKAREYLMQIGSVQLIGVKYDVKPESQALESYAVKEEPDSTPQLVYVAYLNNESAEANQANTIITFHHHFKF